MRRTILLQVVFLLFAFTSQAALGLVQLSRPQELSEAEIHHQKGLEHYQAGRYKESIEAYKRAILLKPDLPAVHYDLGIAYIQLGQHLEALKVFRQAVHLNPRDAAAHCRLGAMHNYFGQYQEAVAILKQAIRLQPDSADAYHNLGIGYDRTGRKQEAIEAFKQAIQLSPNTAATYFNLSKSYQKLGRHEEAIEAEREAKRLGSHNGNGFSTVPLTANNSYLATSVQDDAGPHNSKEANLTGASIARNASLDEPGALLMTSDALPKSTEARAPSPISTESRLRTEAPETAEATSASNLINIYRIGVGDALDIRLLNSPARKPTIFTVSASGLLDYPPAGELFQVAGLTTAEVEARLAAKIKLDDKPRVTVSVHEYVSHTVIINGLVNDPGTKILRREAMPLYVVIADAQPRPEADVALVVSRTTSQSTVVDLTDQAAMSMLIHPSDVVTVQARPPQFFYIGGEIKEPGEKAYRSGITLTQAILVAGGTLRSAGETVEVTRQGADGLLKMSKYNLKGIKSGKTPDPLLQPGDRIEVIH